MKTAWHRVWGSGRGPVGRLCPATRLAAGVLVLGTCLAAPVTSRSGGLLVLAVVAAWVLGCRPPGRLIVAGTLLGLAMFLPAFLLVPWIPVPEGAGLHEALQVPSALLVRGLGGILACGATVASIGVGDLREALVRLRVPEVVASILLQIVHQAAALFAETRSILEALAVRGATARGTASPGLLRALPLAWLPRVAERAERVGEAMELRGYGGDGPPTLRVCRASLGDALALGLAAGALALAVGLRTWGGGP